MVLNFAHRGSLTEAPENTIPAFQKALDHGTKAIELDVQLTKDNELVIIHDHKFTRFNQEVQGLVKDYSLAEIKKIDIGTSFSSQYAGLSLTTLDEVLQLVPKDIFINIEIKNIPVIYDGIEERVLDCLKNHQRMDHVIISSFDHQALATIQKMAPDLPIGVLFYYRILEVWEYTKHCGLDVYSIHPLQTWTDQELIEKSHASGYKVFPYTVSNFSRYEQLLQMGVDGVFSNNPEIFGT